MSNSVLMSSSKVRDFCESDRSAVIELWRTCDLVRPWNDPNLDIDRNLAAQGARFFVAAIDSEVVGSVMAGYDGHRGWINYLAVDRNHRGDGLGTRLMDQAVGYFGEIGCPKINLQIRSGNAEAIAFYERLGFTVDDVVSMGKRLVDETKSDR